MLLFKFIFLVSLLAGSFCMTYQCYKKRELECSDYKISEQEPPKSVDDLRDLCANLIPLGRCILRVFEECAENEEFRDTKEDVESFRESLNFVESSCNEDSQIFEALSNNLNCISYTVETMDDICTPNHLNDTLRQKLYHLAEEESVNPTCYIGAWLVHCINARFDNECGSDVRNTVSEILSNMRFIPLFCKEYVGKLSHWEDAFRREFAQGKGGEDAVPGVLDAITSK